MLGSLDLVQVENLLDSALTTIKNTPAPAPTPLPPPAPPPAPAPPPTIIQRGLPAIQSWLGIKTIGVYIGVEENNWSMAQIEAAAKTIASWKADYALFKIGEGANIWHDGAISDIRNLFFKYGVGFAPYHYCLPGNPEANAQIAAKAANVAGGVVLDIEDEFQGFDRDLAQMFVRTRQLAPTGTIIMSGYGDPWYRFRNNYPHHTIQTALANGVIDGYQAQWYFDTWDMYLKNGFNYGAAISWGDRDVATVYGENCTIQPCISVTRIRPQDLTGSAAILKNWHASVAIWEYQSVNADYIALLRRGMNS